MQRVTPLNGLFVNGVDIRSFGLFPSSFFLDVLSSCSMIYQLIVSDFYLLENSKPLESQTSHPLHFFFISHASIIAYGIGIAIPSRIRCIMPRMACPSTPSYPFGE